MRAPKERNADIPSTLLPQPEHLFWVLTSRRDASPVLLMTMQVTGGQLHCISEPPSLPASALCSLRHYGRTIGADFGCLTEFQGSDSEPPTSDVLYRDDTNALIGKSLSALKRLSRAPIKHGAYETSRHRTGLSGA